MIDIRDLTVGYGGKPVLHSVSAAFPRGKITALVGPNGCGKSTLLKTLAGLLIPDAGVVRIADKLLADMSGKERARQIAYLPQSRNVPEISVRRMVLHGRFPHLDYPRKYRPVDYAAAEEALHKVAMHEWAHTMVSELSGGQRQRVYLAMVLCQQTEVVLLDEPTTYLDLHHQLEMLQLVRQLKEEGKTVIMVLHDLNLALQNADTLAVLSQGRLVRLGTPQQIVESGDIDTVFSVETYPVKQPDKTSHYIFTLPHQAQRGKE